VLPLAIWLFLIGYTIAITGKRNLGLSYKPQADGSIKAVDGTGNQARTYSLMDVITCGEPSGALQGQPAPVGASQSSRPAGTPPPQPTPNLIPLPGLEQLPNPITVIQRTPLPRVPMPNAAGPLQALEGWEKSLAEDVYNGINGLVGGLAGALKRVPLPHLGPAPAPGGLVP
jgi:hypothetical protein